jgi:hypothetical protein
MSIVNDLEKATDRLRRRFKRVENYMESLGTCWAACKPQH